MTKPNIQERLSTLRGKLNLTQTLALPTVRWLLAPRGHFRTGRTHLLAVAILEAALQNPNCEIPILDHGPVGESLVKKYIQDLVANFFEDCPGEIKFEEGSIYYFLEEDNA